MSMAQLNRKLSAQIDYSPAKLILHYRMEYAKQLLDSNSHSIEEIANQCGFNGLTSFSRTFKQEFGSSPSEYRKKALDETTELWDWKIPLSENCFDQLLLLKAKNRWLAKLFTIVIDNLDNELFSIEELASKLFISSSNLNRKVQHLFGFSTARLVRDLRLQHAAELLSTQNKSVTEAASLAGFFDVAHLSRYFKQNFGCSPGEYRNVSVFFSCIDKLKEEVISQIAK
ncbi:helix-turn-helix domain-containing protein [Flavobacterium sp. ZT3R18]|uniref:helix-turn-helix domain-containing protein n=1 Tax=Flavobacterium sp. ZT3R18 TaxID=2594429 RepID=UPI00117A3D6B|nr:helix-turn-helix domain-containing protein [Flavobacterium sp. ZT3R18]